MITDPAQAWTVGKLRAALDGLPDDLLVIAHTADPDDPTVADDQVITDAGFGQINWGDGYGLEEDRSAFGLECDFAGFDWRTRPDRPRRRGRAGEVSS